MTVKSNVQLVKRRSQFLGFSADELQALGQGDVGYVKRYRMKGHLTYVLHGADGKALCVESTVPNIRSAARQQDLNIVMVH